MTTTQRRAPNRTATRKPIDPVLTAHIRLARAQMNATTYPRTDAIKSYVEVRNAADEAIALAVEHARYDGASWADIAAALGVTTQAAHKRYA